MSSNQSHYRNDTTEMIKIGNNITKFSTYSCQPISKKELKKIIEERISKYGSECDLNDIDTSLITDMSFLFYKSKFNGNISNWDVSKVKDMHDMFNWAIFTGDISGWDVSNVEDMGWMFNYSKFNVDISKWDVSNVKSMSNMFSMSWFNQDISNWNIYKYCDVRDMFFSCQIKEEFKPKLPS